MYEAKTVIHGVTSRERNRHLHIHSREATYISHSTYVIFDVLPVLTDGEDVVSTEGVAVALGDGAQDTLVSAGPSSIGPRTQALWGEHFGHPRMRWCRAAVHRWKL